MINLVILTIPWFDSFWSGFKVKILCPNILIYSVSWGEYWTRGLGIELFKWLEPPRLYILFHCSINCLLFHWQHWTFCFQVIVSMMRYISPQTEGAMCFVGLSTALANARCVHLIQSQAPKSYIISSW